MGIGKCVWYLARIGILSFFLGRILPAGWFLPEHFPYRSYTFEKQGRIYEVLGVTKWKDKVPDMSRIFPRLIPPKKMQKQFGEQLPVMIKETCVAELIHGLLALAGFYCLILWPGAGGLVVSVLNMLGNLVFVVIQRYNRPRFIKLQKTCDLLKRKRTVE